jgi:hypothetical protein
MTTEMPTLPAVGALNWGPDVNECLVWLYEQMENNALAIDGLVGEVSTLENVVSALQNEVATLNGYVTVLQARPDFVYDSAPWTYHNGNPPASNQQVRADTLLDMNSKLLDFSLTDLNGAERTPWFARLTTTSVIRIADWDDSTRSHRFRVTGPVVIGNTNAQVPVAWINGVGSIASNQKADVGFFIDVKGALT